MAEDDARRPVSIALLHASLTKVGEVVGERVAEAEKKAAARDEKLTRAIELLTLALEKRL